MIQSKPVMAESVADPCRLASRRSLLRAVGMGAIGGHGHGVRAGAVGKDRFAEPDCEQHVSEWADSSTLLPR